MDKKIKAEWEALKKRIQDRQYHRNVKNLLSAEEVLKRWSIDKYQLRSLVANEGLPFYIPEVPGYKYYKWPSNWEDAKWYLVGMWNENNFPIRLDIDDVLEFENNHPELTRPRLNVKEARELGALRKEKEKFDIAIAAAVAATLFVTGQKTPVIKDQLLDELEKNGFGQITDRQFRVIWETLPSRLRHSGGRPRKTP